MTSIAAAVYTGSDEPIRVTTVELADPGPGEVLVDIAAAGVCGSDLHVVRGDWNVPKHTVLGHEGSGIVAAVGPGVTDLEPGDHVVISWVPSCGECRPCRIGRPVQCAKFAEVIVGKGALFDCTSRLSIGGEQIHHYLGASTFSEKVVVPTTGAIKVRDDAPLEAIALVGCALASGVGAVQNTARVPAGATVAVIGCGGVGLSCIQGARLAGASQIVAVDVRADKLELAAALGATHTIDALAGDPVEQLRALVPDGLDFVFDAVGDISTTEQAIAALGPGGAAVLVGLPPSGSQARFDPMSLVEADQRILGSFYGSIVPQRDIPQFVDLVVAGQLNLESMISARRPLAEIADALAELESGTALRQLLIP